MSLGSFPIAREKDDFLPAGRRSFLTPLRFLDLSLVGVVLALTFIGVVVINGGTMGVPGLNGMGSKQLVFFWIALVAMLGVFLADYRWLNRMALLLYMANIAALLFVLVAGTKINGARSWINLGPVNWQPSETMKLATALVCSQWLALYPEKLTSWTGVFFPAMICGVPALLILAQPDLGTASLFFVMFMAMMLIAGVDRKKLALIIFATLIGMASVYPFLKPYQKARIMVFMNPELDPRGDGYNVIQSKIAIGSGGFFGKGWGEGTQCTHRFLPEHHTDFIFASAIEQFGFLGGLVILFCYLMIIWRMISAMDRARDRFGGIVVAGLLAIIVCHLCLNIGMTMGLVPVTGIPLPFLSYGGSFLVTTYLMFGLVLNVSSRRFTFISD